MSNELKPEIKSEAGLIKCPYCDAKFTTRAGFRYHIHQKHPDKRDEAIGKQGYHFKPKVNPEKIEPKVEPENKPENKPEIKPEIKPEPKPESKIEYKPEKKPEPKHEIKEKFDYKKLIFPIVIFVISVFGFIGIMRYLKRMRKNGDDKDE